VARAKDDHVIEKLPANASNGALRGSVLPGASQCGSLQLHTKALDRVVYRRREDRIAVMDDEPMGSLIGERLTELLDHSASGWVRGDIEVENCPPSVIDREPDVQQAKSNRWDDEEVHACDHLPAVAEEGDSMLLPARIRRDLWPVTRYGRNPDPDTQIRSLGLDLPCSPAVLGGHLNDECSSLL